VQGLIRPTPYTYIHTYIHNYTPHHEHRGSGVQLHVFLTLASDGGKLATSCPILFTYKVAGYVPEIFQILIVLLAYLTILHHLQWSFYVELNE
jgi:hypothetical protein